MGEAGWHGARPEQVSLPGQSPSSNTKRRAAGRKRRGLQEQRRRRLLIAICVGLLVAAVAGLVGKRLHVLRKQQLEQRLWLESALDAAGLGLNDTQLSEGGAGQGAAGGSTGGAGGDASATSDPRETIALWPRPLRSGWLPHSSPIEPQNWPSAPLRQESTGFVVVRCNGGLNQQRSAIGNAVVVARILNATLVVPRLDTNDFWNDSSSFSRVYDVDHFIRTLASDVRIVRKLPAKLKPARLKPPREAPVSWYLEEVAPALAKKRAVSFSPFAHRLSEELGTDTGARELQRLRCRVQYHALRFTEPVRRAADAVVARLHSVGPFIAIHMRFEKDMLAFAGCFDIFSEAEQRELQAYREKNFAEKELNPSKRRQIGKCPLTPEEAGLIVRSMSFPNDTQIFLAAGRLYHAHAFLPPLQRMFPRLTNRTALAAPEDARAIEGQPLLAQAVDYLVCLQADLFIPTYDGPSNFANNVIGHRMYSGFVGTVRPDRKALAQLVGERKKGNLDDRAFELAVRQMVYKVPLVGPYSRVLHHQHQHHIPFLANPWPECFCKDTAYHEDAFSQHPDTGGFELSCPAGYNGTGLS